MARGCPKELIKSSELSVAGAVVMICMGLLGIFLSFATRLAPSTLAGWIFVVVGFAYFAYAFATRNDGEVAWQMLTGFRYVFAGLYLFLFVSGLQLQHVFFLTGSILLVEGLVEFFIGFRLRPNRRFWMDWRRGDIDDPSRIHYLVSLAVLHDACGGRNRRHEVCYKRLEPLDVFDSDAQETDGSHLPERIISLAVGLRFCNFELKAKP